MVFPYIHSGQQSWQQSHLVGLMISLKIYFCFMYTGVLPECMSVRVSDPMEMELQTVGSYHVGSGNRIRSSARATVFLTAEPLFSAPLSCILKWIYLFIYSLSQSFSLHICPRQFRFYIRGHVSGVTVMPQLF